MQIATKNDVIAREYVVSPETDKETDDLGKEEQKSRFFLLRVKENNRAATVRFDRITKRGIEHQINGLGDSTRCLQNTIEDP